MPGKLARLHNGERWVACEIAMRGMGVVALASSWRTIVHAQRLVGVAENGPGLSCYALATVAFILLSVGLGLLLFGPGLLRHVTIPRSSIKAPHPRGS